MFSDQYLDKEENGKLQEVIWQWMTSDDITLNTIDADDPDVSDLPPSLSPLPPSPSNRSLTITSYQRLLSQLRGYRPVSKSQRR